MIRRVGGQIEGIHVTLDAHHLIHVAHPIYWRDPYGQHPPTFTIITPDDVREGRWAPTHEVWLKQTRQDFGVLDYVGALEANGKYPLCIWPPHCLLGSWGQCVFPPLLDVLHEWETQKFAAVNFVSKGSHFHTEHYSAIRADLPAPHEPCTHINSSLREALSCADEILLAGKADSHCLAKTIFHVLKVCTCGR